MAGNGSGTLKSKIPTAFLLLFAALFLAGKAAGGGMETVLAQGEPFPGEPQGRTADIVAKDLNFDGWDDLCIRKPYDGRVNVPYSCMLWNPQKERFEYSVTLYNVETDPEMQWISSRIRESGGRAGDKDYHPFQYTGSSRAYKDDCRGCEGNLKFRIK